MTRVNFDHVIHLSGMFKNLTTLKTVKFPTNIKPVKYRDMSEMFRNCLRLEEVDLSMFRADTIDMQFMLPRDIKQVRMPQIKEIKNQVAWVFNMGGDHITEIIFTGDGDIKAPLDKLCYERRDGLSHRAQMRNVNLHIPEGMFSRMNPLDYENLDDSVSITVY